MNQTPLRFAAKLRRPLLLAALCCFPLGGACSSSDSTAVSTIEFSVAVTLLDGASPDQQVDLRCDRTLSVSVAIASIPADRFTLRPPNACGTSERCGYVHVEALSAAGTSLASVDSATTAAVLDLKGVEELADLSQIRVSLIRGLDGQPLLNPDETEVASVVTPSFVVPTDCPSELPGGAGGAGGAGSAEPSGGAGGAAPLPELGGASVGGQADSAGGASVGGAALAGTGGV